MKHCRKQQVKKHDDETKSYSCSRCQELMACKKEPAKLARCMHTAMGSVSRLFK